MNSMENFFNWMSKPLPKEEVIIWFNVNNMTYEKIELYGDIFKSLYHIIKDTYLGNDEGETKIFISNEDKTAHFNWCFEKTLSDFLRENVKIKNEGTHKSYFQKFFFESFYDQKDTDIIKEIPMFLDDIFELSKPFSKSDLDILTEIYKLMEHSVE